MSKIVLWVSDIQAQAVFYAAIFDCPMPEISGTFAEVSSVSNSVLLHAMPAEYAAAVPLTKQLAIQDEVAIKPVFTVDSIDAAASRAEHTFATFSDVKNTYGDFTYCDVVDPEGNVIQLQQQN